MGQQIPISSSFNLPDGRQVTLETGKLASLADGSVVVRIGDTMLFATVVSSTSSRTITFTLNTSAASANGYCVISISSKG